MLKKFYFKSQIIIYLQILKFFKFLNFYIISLYLNHGLDRNFAKM
jgi:hypothetical protein